MQFLTASKAAKIYGLSSQQFTLWAEQGKFAGAKKVNHIWKIPKQSIEEFFTNYPSLRQSSVGVTILRSQSSQQILSKPRPKSISWDKFSIYTTIIGFIVDVIAVYDIIRGGTLFLLWAVATTASSILWIISIYILRPQISINRIRSNLRSRSIFIINPRYANSPLTKTSKVVFYLVPLIAIFSTLSYQIWRSTPPSQTVVLIADFVDPNGNDSRDVTFDLV